jgi:uncharacterized membrane protein
MARTAGVTRHGTRPTDRRRSVDPPRLPGFLFGLGLGGFIDGIVLHQILQWHHMLTDTGNHPATTVVGLEENTLADGFFHLSTWVLVSVAMLLTTRAWQRKELAPPWRAHVGMLLVGWGVFNLVEGVINHQILNIHHVRDDLGGPVSWDIGFLVFGAVLVVVGVALVKAVAVVEDRAPGPGPAA